MTFGELLFGCGVGLLVLTILLAIIFLIKKPRYEPEIVYEEHASHKTQHLRNGYPTNPLTIRRESVKKTEQISKKAEGTLPLAETKKLSAEETELLSETPVDAGETVLLGEKLKH